MDITERINQFANNAVVSFHVLASGQSLDNFLTQSDQQAGYTALNVIAAAVATGVIAYVIVPTGITGLILWVSAEAVAGLFAFAYNTRAPIVLDLPSADDVKKVVKTGWNVVSGGVLDVFRSGGNEEEGKVRAAQEAARGNFDCATYIGKKAKELAQQLKAELNRRAAEPEEGEDGGAPGGAPGGLRTPPRGGSKADDPSKVRASPWSTTSSRGKR